MEWFVIVVILLAVILAGGVWWVGRRRREALSDDEEWAVPDQSAESPVNAPPEYFDRDALLHRPRTLNPQGWDNTPDAEAKETDIEGDLPAYFDRDYLASRQRQEPTEG